MYQFILTDLDLNPVGEILNASDRQMAWGIRSIPQTTFRVRGDNPLADILTSCECYLKVYNDRVLKAFGPVIASEEVGDNSGGSVAVTAVGQAWIFTHRLVGRSVSGQAFSTLTDRAQIAKSLIDTANTVGTMRVKTDPLSYSGSTITYTAGPYKTVAAALGELGNTLDGFDWRVDPMEPDGSGNIGLWTAAPTLSVARPEAIFEYGIGRHNVSDYKVQTSRDSQANEVYNVGNSDVISQLNTVSIAKWGLMEATADLLLNDNNMRQKLVDEHVNVRSDPRRVVTFTPHIDDGTGRVPRFGLDYDVGDIVVARAARNDVVRFNGDFRVYGATVQLDANGVERVQLTLTDEDS